MASTKGAGWHFAPDCSTGANTVRNVPSHADFRVYPERSVTNVKDTRDYPEYTGPTMKTLRSMARLRWWLLAWFAFRRGCRRSPIFQPRDGIWPAPVQALRRSRPSPMSGTVEFGAVRADCPCAVLRCGACRNAVVPVSAAAGPLPVFHARALMVAAGGTTAGACAPVFLRRT